MVEKLISSFLDTGSILALAKYHQLTLDLLNTGNSVWNKLISRTCPESIRINLGHIRPPRVMSDRMVMTTGGVLQQERAEMANLVVILKMLEDPKTRLLAILDLICKRFAHQSWVQLVPRGNMIVQSHKHRLMNNCKSNNRGEFEER